jgi:hypothetical protein
MLRLIAVLLALTHSAEAEERTMTFAPSDAEIMSPERGWWLFAAEDFAQATEEEIADVSELGMTVAYGIVRLDDYRDADLTPEFLASLQQRFDWSRKHGIKIILRFAYNYPGSSQDYEDAKDAPLPQVLAHIEQLGPLIAANADTILVLQAGFIGAWGELHTSSNDLDTPDAKATIRDALYSTVPDKIPLQWRYPPDILSWSGDTRMGFNNDCFLSSETDVGTYDEDPAVAANQRAAMEELTDRHYFSGETCDADVENLRSGCDQILAEGARFHLSALNATYYEAFHKAWKAQGCFKEVTRKMGYRLRLVQMETDGNAIRLTIANDGWARPLQARPVVLITFRDGAETGRTVLTGTLAELGAGDEKSFSATLPEIAGADRLCIAAPDVSPRLSNTPAYAVRFANSDQDGQAWDAALGAFCL